MILVHATVVAMRIAVLAVVGLRIRFALPGVAVVVAVAVVTWILTRWRVRRPVAVVASAGHQSVSHLYNSDAGKAEAGYCGKDQQDGESPSTQPLW